MAFDLALECIVDKLGLVGDRPVVPRYHFDIVLGAKQRMAVVFRRHSEEGDIVNEGGRCWMNNDNPAGRYDSDDNMDEVRIRDVEEGIDEGILPTDMLGRLVEGQSFGHLCQPLNGEAVDLLGEQSFEAPPSWRKVW